MLFAKDSKGLKLEGAQAVVVDMEKHSLDEILVHVNGGHSLYRRRKGLKNALAESKLQLLLYQCKIKPLSLAVFHLILRTTFLLLPSKIVEKIYIDKLRNNN